MNVAHLTAETTLITFNITSRI